MSAAWTTWQDELPVLFAALLGLSSSSACAWATQPRRQMHGPRAQIDVIATPAQGVEDRRLVSDDGGAFELGGETITGILTEELTGQRQLVLQVSVWHDRQALPTSARALLERLRTGLGWESTRRSLRDLELAYVLCRDPVNLDPTEDGRTVSRWAMDVVLAYASVESDVENPTNWFESARLHSQSLRDPGGTPLSTQVDVTIDLIPEA